jgi:hypothetical protein
VLPSVRDSSGGPPRLEGGDEVADVVAVVDEAVGEGAGLPEAGVDGRAEGLLEHLPGGALGRGVGEGGVGELAQAAGEAGLFAAALELDDAEGVLGGVADERDADDPVVVGLPVLVGAGGAGRSARPCCARCRGTTRPGG